MKKPLLVLFQVSVLVLFAPMVENLHSEEPNKPAAAYADLTQRIDTAIKSDVEKGFSGSVLVVRGSATLLDKGYGMEHGIAMRTDSKYWIASAGKQFVSAAIMKCQDEGKLNLNDPVSKFFPGAPSDKRNITVRQLLAHTSGFDQVYSAETDNNRAQAVGHIFSVPLIDSPGAHFHYSNNNYELAAATVEIASGDDYHRFLLTHLLGPAHLQNTGFSGTSAATSVVPSREDMPKRLAMPTWGDAGVFSTTHDLMIWYRALGSGKLITKPSERELFAPVISIKEGRSALGWFLGKTQKGATTIFTRGNEDFGPNSLLYAYPESDTIIIVLTHAGMANDDISWSRLIHQKIESLLSL